MVYLDNAATTPLSVQVKKKIEEVLDAYGNPSAENELGYQAKRIIEEAREHCASSVNAQNNEIYFTSGGTEGDNWALYIGSHKGKAVVTTPFEHKAILNYLSVNNIPTYFLSVDSNGYVQCESLENILETDDDIGLVSVMYVNNELGTIQPIKELAAISHKHNVLFHTDAVQAMGKIPIDVKELDVDFLNVSGHKFHAPKGVGFMYIRDGLQQPMICGGGQERSMRAGTENVISIAGLGAAALEIPAQLKLSPYRNELSLCFIEEMSKHAEGFKVNIHSSDYSAGIVSFRIDEVNADNVVVNAGLNGIVLSVGSACTSSSISPSHVLKSIELSDEEALSSLRVSFYGDEDVCIIREVAKEISKISNNERQMEELIYGKNI